MQLQMVSHCCAPPSSSSPVGYTTDDLQFMWQTGDPVQMDAIALPQFDIRQEDIDYGNCTKFYAGTGGSLLKESGFGSQLSGLRFESSFQLMKATSFSCHCVKGKCLSPIENYYHLKVLNVSQGLSSSGLLSSFYQLFSRISEHILSFLTEFLIWSPGLTREELTHALAE